MGPSIIALLLALAGLAACASPEAIRSRGRGPGADVGNRAKSVEMHEGANQFYKTPQLIPPRYTSPAATLEGNQARRQ